MSENRVRLIDCQRAQSGSARTQPLARVLMEHGGIAAEDMLRVLTMARQTGATPAQVVVAEALATPETVLHAQALHWGATQVDPARTPPDPQLNTLLAPEFCLSHGILPWHRIGDTLLIATARPDDFDALHSLLPDDIGPVTMALALERDIQTIIADRHGPQLVRDAEHWVRAEESCRDLNLLTPRRTAIGLLFASLCLCILALSPQLFFAAAFALALVALIFAQILKVGAAIAAHRSGPIADTVLQGVTPTMSILVPLYREERIAEALLARLDRLQYPRAQLDVILALEATDQQTRSVLAAVHLPSWIRVIEVPSGSITTKPRALNYVLRFCRGEIIGIYDAEDAPAPDQLLRVAGRFSRAPPQMACLQGILDFYNPRANWLSRCFAIEYATWFRVVLPGVARLGFPIPLGGTTVFFRRTALDHVQGWDAHNVTEDADLGVRLARYGYRTELLASVTREEANNRPWPWVKQRSRWLKGYMITYLVHIRHPLRLWRDLGTWKAVGFNIFFLSSILQVLLAPILWTFWLKLIGLPHPLDGILTASWLTALIGLFLTSEAISLIVAIAAVARSPHQRLMLWIPTMILYFPLAVFAAYKALYEVVARPFYWDKTAHGHSLPDSAGADLPPD
ncbi:glycosyltransferase [Puniceibacterium sp. IMCC21224]|uniref:glycosyltransferase family 2 protein n=1 Tax=Puniceibacterium sp. IMCC21224 TaxID=1618204 RepID=UPI001E5C22A8|nr:glycosyltransferase [Puniceibacterium sp. IMCC21224]